MKDYVIITDGNADLPADYAAENGIVVIPMGYNLDGKVYGEGEDLDPKEFYAMMRDGKMPTTMALNPYTYEAEFRKVLESGRDVLYLCFSSGLSNSYNASLLAKQTLEAENPEWHIVIVDSLAASMGQGLFVYKVQQQKLAGKSIEEAAAWAQAHKLNICHQFTVDDLMHLHRGGRVSKATAIVGTLIHVKPVLHVDNEGHLISLFNVRGRKKALGALVDNMEKTMGKFAEDNKDIIFISHGDCEEDALYVKKKIEERFGFHNFMINMICPTIGAHSGPGTIAVFFMGETR